MKAKLNKRVFSVNLREDGSGSYVFGLIDPSAYTGPLTRVPIDMRRGLWEFNSTTFAIDGEKTYNGGASPGVAGELRGRVAQLWTC